MRAEESSPVAITAGEGAGTAPANARAILRVGNEFFLRSIDGIVTAQGNDLIAGLIFTAIWIANVRHITRSAANLKFGGINDLPPDEQRIPVSVQALSNTLRIPYETVRRYVQAMIEDGVCIRVGKRGVIIPAAVHDLPQRRRIFQDGFPSLLRFLEEMRGVGFDFAPYHRALPNTVPLAPGGGLPANGRALLRVTMELVMRGVDMLGRLHHGDFLTGMISTAIWTANVRPVTCSRDTLKYGGMHTAVPDALRQPVTVNAVATTLRLPYETTRRYVSAMVRDGALVRIEGKGVIVPYAHSFLPDYYDAAREFYGHIVRTVSDLHRAGFDFRNY